MPVNGRGATVKDEAQGPNRVLCYRHQRCLLRRREIELAITKHAIKSVLGENINQTKTDIEQQHRSNPVGLQTEREDRKEGRIQRDIQ